MKKALFFYFLFSIFYFLPHAVRAEYVLPYPSYMPGNKLYAVSKIAERVKSWWYWGSIGQTKYHMNLADKYLVEAKTLFEYKQYMLAVNALRTSDEHIMKVPLYIARAKSEGKNMDQFEQSFAAEKYAHRQILEKLKAELPKTFIWTPEREAPATLDIEGLLLRAITLRM